MNEPYDKTTRANGKDEAHAAEHGLVAGAAAIGIALIEAGETIAIRTIEASTRIAESLVRSGHAIASELVQKSGETLQQIVDLGRDTAERALEAAGSAVEGAGRFGERTSVSLSEAISPLAGSRPSQRSNGAITASAA